MNWTPNERLKLIKALCVINGPKAETYRQLMERIMFLCDMPDQFLENNRANYEDAIKLAKADITVEL